MSDNDKRKRIEGGLNIGRRTALKLGSAAGLMALAPSTAAGSNGSEPGTGSAQSYHDDWPVSDDMLISGPEFESEWQRRRYEYGLQWHAKQLANGVFVIGRDPDEYIKNDLTGFEFNASWHLNHLHRWEDVDVDIDYDAERVTLSADGVTPRTAVHHGGGLGVSILPRGEDDVFFDPVDVSTDLPPADEMEWPMGDVDALEEDHPDVDYATLEHAFDALFDNESYDDPQLTRGVVVIYDGKIIGERYADGFDQDTRHIGWSMGKSIASAVVGTAVKDGHIDVDDPAPVDLWHNDDRSPGPRGLTNARPDSEDPPTSEDPWGPPFDGNDYYNDEYPDPRSEIRVRDLLNMTSGLEFNRSAEEADETPAWGPADDHIYVYYGAIDAAEWSRDNHLRHAPGTVFQYRNSNPILSANDVVRGAVGLDQGSKEHLCYPRTKLFDKIGARSLVVDPDPYGNFLMQGHDWATTRDFARFGLLHLQDGEFAGEQVLPSWWTDEVIQPSSAEDGYGGLWWLNTNQDSQEDVPADAYWAAGVSDQRIHVIPSEDLVIARNGHTGVADWNYVNSTIVDAVNN